MKPNKKTPIIIIGTILILVIFFFTFIQQTVFQDRQLAFSFNQIYGRYDIDFDPPQIFEKNELGESTARRQTFSNVAILGEYKIVQSKKASHTTFIDKCKTLPPNAIKTEKTRIDEDGCQRWTYYVQSEGVRLQFGLSPSGTCPTKCIRAGYAGSLKEERDVDRGIMFCTCYKEQKFEDFGGIETIKQDPIQDCWFNATIYKNNKIVKEIEWTRQTSVQWEDNGFFATFNQNSVYHYPKECLRLNSNYYYQIPKDSIKLEVVPVSQFIFQGRDYVAKVKITNNWKPVKANLSVLFRIPTTIGDAKAIQSQIVNIPLGTSEHEYTIPTKQVTDRIFATPEILIFEPTTSFSGVNTACFGDSYPRDVKQCKQLDIAIIEGETVETQILSQTYIKYDGDECKSLYGYEPNSLKTFCIRADLGNLSCIQRGCPTFDINGNPSDYVCSGSGICEEVLFYGECKTDADCTAHNAVCELDTVSGSKACVREEIVEKIKEIDTPVYIEKKLTCEEFNPCPDNYECQDKDNLIQCMAQEKRCGFFCKIWEWIKGLVK